MAEKLERIEAHLRKHPSVKVFKEHRENLLDNPDQIVRIAHRTFISVVPDIVGLPGLFTAEPLNHLFMSLIPSGCDPERHVQFADTYLDLGLNRLGAWMRPYTSLRSGWCEFEEQIGAVQQTEKYVITDKALKGRKTAGFDGDGVREIVHEEQPLIGLISLRLWPCREIAAAAELPENETWTKRIPVKEFGAYR